MELKNRHLWPTTKYDAVALLKEMADRVEIVSNHDEIKTIVAVDTAYGRNAESVFAAAVVFTFPEIEEIDRSFQFDDVTFPYIPGLFYFREGPTIIKALEKLKTEPDMLIIHGPGIAHPQRCGIASMVGLAFDKPTIGCCRKLLIGQHRPVAPSKGNFQPIALSGKTVGYAYRSKDGVKPLFISPGHRCSIDESKEIIQKNLRGFRLPEPLRFAHLYANKFKRHIENKSSPRRTVGDDLARS